MMIRKNEGFTLVEVMMGLGVSSVLILAVMQIMTKTQQSSRLAQQEEQINSIVFRTMSLLRKKNSCDASLTGFSAVGAGNTVSVLRNGTGNPALSIGDVRGTGPGRIGVQDITLGGYQTGDFQGSNKATVTVTLRRASAIGVDLNTISAAERQRLSKLEGTSRLEVVHKFPVSILTGAGGVVNECEYTFFSLDDDLDRACALFSGTIVADKCHNITVNAADSTSLLATAAVGAEVFANGHVTQYNTGTSFFNTGALETDTALNPLIDVDVELLRVNSLSTRSLSLGTELIPTDTGYLNTSGDILVGSTGTAMPGGTEGLYVEGGLEAGGTMTLLDPINPTGADENLVVSADWAAGQIADTMANNSVSIDTIKDNILSGGTSVATLAILEYICENTYFRRINFSNGFGNASTQLETVPGVWNGSQCILEATFKRNCSVPGQCNTVSTNRLCLGGNCMTRWPYIVKGSCSWTNSCPALPSGGRARFGENDNTLSGRYLCCSTRMSDVDP